MQTKSRSKKRRKKSLRVRLRKTAWDLCSKYIRLHYADREDYVQCYTCPTKKYWKEMQAGHGLSGRYDSILLELDLLRPQCYGCNIPNHGRHDVFAYKLIKEYGIERYNELHRQRLQDKKFTIQELEEKVVFFRQKLEEELLCEPKL